MFHHDKEGHTSQMLREEQERSLGMPSQSLAPWHSDESVIAALKTRVRELQGVDTNHMAELLDSRQKRAEVLHDIIVDAREIVRTRLKPDSPKHERDVFDKLQEAKYVLAGDPFDMMARECLKMEPRGARPQGGTP